MIAHLVGGPRDGDEVDVGSAPSFFVAKPAAFDPLALASTAFVEGRYGVRRSHTRRGLCYHVHHIDFESKHVVILYDWKGWSDGLD